MTTGGPSVPPGRAHRVLAGILVLSAALSLVGMSWGLPTPFSGTWAWDELSPDDRPTLARTHHGGRYPPLHYYVLAAFYAPVDWLDLPEVESTNAKRYVGRSVSLAMSLAALLVLYRLGLATLRAPGPSLLAVAVLALSPTFAYYSKTANLEVPYLLWLLVAVLFSVRVLRHHRRRDYWGYALASLAAITTKDQAFGLLVLPSLVMPFALARHRDGAIRPRGVVAALLDRRLILPALTSFLAFFVIHNVVFDFEGFRHHLWIMVRGSGKFREHEPTLAGHLAMARQAVQHVGFVMGVPAALAAVGGLWSLAREHRRTAVWLSLFPISYYLFFITPILYHYDRFFLPVAAILALFAGFALWRLATAAGALRFAGRGLIGLVLLFGLYRVAVLDAALLTDTRYEAERWTAEREREGATVAAFMGSRQLVPRITRYVRWDSVKMRGASSLADSGSPDYLIFGPLDAITRGAPSLLPSLTDGSLGYEMERDFRPRVDFRRRIPPGVSTNLRAISPELTASRRVVELVFDPWTVSAALVSGERGDWAAAGAEMLDAPVCPRRQYFPNGMVAFNVSPDRWTRGTEVALVARRNETREPRDVTLVVAAGPSREAEIGARLVAPGIDRRLALTPGEPTSIRLGTVEPGEVAMVAVAAEEAWSPDGDRDLGVRVRMALDRPDAGQEADGP